MDLNAPAATTETFTAQLSNVSLGLGTSTTPSFAADAPATIVVGDQAFTVSSSQLAFDAPSFFSDALNGWAESSNRRMCVASPCPG